MKVAAVAAALTICTIAAAGDRDAQWREVREAVGKGLPASAVKALEPIIRDALRDGAYPEAIRAVVQRIALEAKIQGDKPEEKIRRLQSRMGEMPAATRPVLEAILARWYWDYFQDNRWRFVQRSRTAAPPGDDFTTWDLPRIYAEIDLHFTRALAARDLLQRTPIAAYDALLLHGTAPDACRPTLYDFIAWEALAFYESGEQAGARPEDAFAVTADGPVFASVEEFIRWPVATADSTSPACRAIRLYQDLLRFHAADADPSARLDTDLARLRFGWNQTAGPEKSARYKAALERMAERYADHPLSASALAAWAGVLHDEGDLRGARRLAMRGADRFPDSPGGAECYNLVQRIEAKSLSISTERVWNAPLPTLDVRYRNLERVYFRAVPFDFEQGMNAPRHQRPEHLDDAELRAVLARTPARAWSAALPAAPDFAERQVSLPAPRGLAPGSYHLLASDDAGFGTDRHVVFLTSFWVSDLALVLRDRRGGGVEGFVLHAVTGRPIGGAEIRWWVHASSGPVLRPSVFADRDGRFQLRAGEALYTVLALHEEQRLASEDPRWAGSAWREPGVRRTLLFTDRALYRPGQTIHYKGLCVDADPERDRYEVMARHALAVSLRDVNGKEIARRDHVTNDHGSFSGSFVAPGDRLLGAMRLVVQGDPPGTAVVSVEEYKRPKFTVTLEAPAAPARLGAEVAVEGRATAYTGAPVDGAQVRWRVTRAVRYPEWWSWRYWWRSGPAGVAQEIAHGTATTRADGRFTLAFTARPDSAAGAEDEPVFTFAISADVTDLAGETRSAGRDVRAGYTTLRAALSAGAWQVSDRRVEIAVRTTSLDGLPRAAAGILTVRRLRQPASVARARLTPGPRAPWDARSSTAPEPDASDPATWPADEEVFTGGVTVDTTGAARVTVALPAGAYRATFQTRDASGRAVSAELPLRVLDPRAERCALKVPDLLAAPAWSVEPGGEFVALWGSGYEDVRAYVEVEHRGRPLQAYWTAPGRSQHVIRQRVSEAMRGGFIVRVTMVRENRAYLHEERVDVPWSSKVLALRWEHFVSKLEPGQRETWTAVVTGPDATRAAAEMVATLYDASLDAYRAHAWPTFAGLFRTERGGAGARLENSAADLRPVAGHWPASGRSASLSYRAFPAEVLSAWGGPMVMMFQSVEVHSERRLDTRSSATKQAIAGAPSPGRTADGVSVDDFSRGGRADEMVFLAQGAAEPGVRPGARPDLGAIVPRRNLEETAFFFPHLLADGNGEVRMSFTMPEALTEWRFMGFAHDPELRSGLLTGRAVTARDLMAQPNPPRFLRAGDVLEFPVTVTNLSDVRQAGRVRLAFADAVTGAPADAALGNRASERAFDVPARETRTYAWRLTVPDGLGALTYRAVASTGRQSDGEEGVLPVLERRVLVTESLPLPIRGPATREFDFTRLRLSGASPTLAHQSLTVQMVSNPAWYAVMALPYLMEYPYECTEQTFNRLYANALARHIAASDPRIRRVFDQWRGTTALDSPLEKNQALKAVTLEETPWLRQAKAESQARRDVGILFDANRLDDETERTLRRLKELQRPDGAWPWFPGGLANDYITLYITTGFGRLRHLGVKVDEGPALRSLGRLDGWADAMYRDLLRHGRRDANNLSTAIALYLYGRSFFLEDRRVPAGSREAVDYWLEQARRHWLSLPGRQSQAHVALALDRFGDRATARAIMRSLRERAVRNEELGMFWREDERSWWWYRAPIETQAVLIEAFQEVAGDSAAVEECRVWLLKQKQTQDWKTTKATADAVYALLLRGQDLLAPDALVEVALGGRRVRPERVEAGTGFYEKRFGAGEITPALARVTVARSARGVAWGSVHWQYFEDMRRVTPFTGTPLTLRKSLYTRRASPRGPVLEPVTGPVRVGDELVVRVELRVDRDMEYVHLKDHRGSGVEPVNVLSGYRYQDGLRYYQETRDAASHFFIDYLPKGTYVFEYAVRVQHRGRYQSGMAQVQCMYAPEFDSHSGSQLMDVR